MSAHNKLQSQAKKLGLKGSGTSAQLRARIAAKRRLLKARKQRRAPAAKRPTASAIRRRKAANKRLGKRIGAAVRRGERKGASAARKATRKRVRKKVTLTMLDRQRDGLMTQHKNITKRMDKLKARQNKGGFDAKSALRCTGFVLGGMVTSNFATAIAKKAMKDSEHAGKVSEYVAPALLAGASYYLGQKKDIKWLSDKDSMCMIGGIAGAVVLRNVDAVKDAVAKIPGIGALVNMINDLPAKVGLGGGHYGMGAYMRVEEDPDFGMGEYVYDGGMGRYVADPFQVGQASLNGFGEYVQTGPIGIPAIEVEGDEIAQEAMGMEGLGAADLSLESIVPDAGQKIIRALPSVAQSLSDDNVGQILGESQQLPGSLLVAVSVAGRDVKLDAGPIRATDYGPAPIQQAANIAVSPQGVFSRSVFTPTIPGGRS